MSIDLDTAAHFQELLAAKDRELDHYRKELALRDATVAELRRDLYDANVITGAAAERMLADLDKPASPEKQAQLDVPTRRIGC